MKKTTQKLLFFMLAGMGISIANAQVVPEGFYEPMGNTEMKIVYDDADNGDGVMDGAHLFDGKDSVGPLGAIFNFNGTIEDGETYNVATYVYNSGNSYADFYVILYNKTKGTELDVSDRIVVQKNDAGATLVEVSYVGTAADAGDKLQLIYEREELNTGRDFKVDNISLNGTIITVVEPPLDPVSPSGTWGVIDEDYPVGESDGPTVLKVYGEDAVILEGTILVDGRNGATGNNQGAKFTLAETITAGTRYKAATELYNPRVSYVNVKLQLYNVTEDKALATSARINMLGTPAGGVLTVGSESVSYVATAADAGDVLEIRWIRDDGGNTARDFGISKATINDVALNTATLSVKNTVLSEGVSVYPNPSNSFLNINVKGNVSIKRTALVDVTGKQIFEQSNARPIDVRNFSKGMYILQLESQDGAVLSKKVLVN